VRTIWLFRSDLRILEYYHQYLTLEEFEEKCHDFYLLMLIWYLRNNYFDEAIVWRLSKNKKNDIIFNIDGKKFIQRWVQDLSETFSYSSPEISFFRGGFQIYDQVTKKKPKHFNLKLYLGAGQRTFPRYGGRYDKIMLEDKSDFNPNFVCGSFYKTANPSIFHPVDKKLKYDICWPCNFSQIRYKGQEFFISSISKSKFLSSLRIVHVGNKPEVGQLLCKKYGVNNIEFKGWLERPEMNDLLNQSKLGINLSNRIDGCPRISTEILMSGTPMILRDQTRLLDYYKQKGVVIFDDNNLEEIVKHALIHHKYYKQEVLEAIKNELSFDTICELNIKEWKK